jgi:predicted ArsR family transcriptional regulator
MLNHILAVFRRRFAPQELRASLREVGRTVAQEHLENVKGKSRDQRIEFALNLLRTLGGDAMGEESEGKYFIRGNGCPLSAATADHLEACLIVEALLSEIIETPVPSIVLVEEHRLSRSAHSFFRALRVFFPVRLIVPPPKAFLRTEKFR